MSGAFKSVSFSLTEIGKPGSQAWMKVSLLGGIGSPGSLLAHDQEQVKEETLFLFEPPCPLMCFHTGEEICFGI